MFRNKNQLHNQFNNIIIATFNIIIILIVICSLLFLVYLQQEKQGGRDGLQLCLSYNHSLLKYGAMQVRVNISLYGYILMCIA